MPEDGIFVAVAYIGGKFYIGKIFSCNDERDQFELDFMSWSSGQNKELYWPTIKDVRTVAEKFIYINDVTIFKSSNRDGRYSCQPDSLEIKRLSNIYKELHGFSLHGFSLHGFSYHSEYLM